MTRAARFWFAALLTLTPCAVPAQQPVIVGIVLTQSGILADLAADLRKGLLLWQQDVNASGGLLGRRVELRLLDDRSDSGAVRVLYEQLIHEQRADVLIGPFGSAAALAAVGVAEANRRVLLNASGASRATQRASHRYVFQITAPYGAYARGWLEISRDLGYHRILIAARNDPVAREMAEKAQNDAAAFGLQIVATEIYAAGSDDFRTAVETAKATKAQAWIAFGLPQDAAAIVRTFRKLGYAPSLFAAQGVSDAQFVKRVGQDAEFALGVAPWMASAGTAGNAEFVQAYLRQWSVEPTASAAQGYAAGKVLEHAVRRAGSLETEALRSALSSLRAETPLGAYEVDAGGSQLGAHPVVVQIHSGRREIVWPQALATAKWRLPYPRWEERRIAK